MASELGVQTIQHTNGTDALTVGSDGSVTLASKLLLSGQTEWPAFRVGNNSDISVTATGDQTVNWQNTSTNGNFIQGGFTYSSGTFTVPVTGLYSISFSYDIRDLGSGYVIGRTWVNGNYRLYVIDGSIAPDYGNLTGSTVLKLTAGDTFYYTTISSTDASYKVAGDSSAACHLIVPE